MQFEWDDKKAKANKSKHGIAFAVAAAALEGFCVEKTDDRYDYGEERIISICSVAGVVLSVVYTVRNGTTRIISARKANRNEQATYTKAANS